MGVWDGKDDEGNFVPTGSYFYPLEVKDKAGNEYSTKPQKIIVETIP